MGLVLDGPHLRVRVRLLLGAGGCAATATARSAAAAPRAAAAEAAAAAAARSAARADVMEHVRQGVEPVVPVNQDDVLRDKGAEHEEPRRAAERDLSGRPAEKERRREVDEDQER